MPKCIDRNIERAIKHHRRLAQRNSEAGCLEVVNIAFGERPAGRAKAQTHVGESLNGRRSQTIAKFSLNKPISERLLDLLVNYPGQTIRKLTTAPDAHEYVQRPYKRSRHLGITFELSVGQADEDTWHVFALIPRWLFNKSKQKIIGNDRHFIVDAQANGTAGAAKSSDIVQIVNDAITRTGGVNVQFVQKKRRR